MRSQASTHGASPRSKIVVHEAALPLIGLFARN